MINEIETKIAECFNLMIEDGATDISGSVELYNGKRCYYEIKTISKKQNKSGGDKK